jgi:hypothetical protein
MNNLMTNTAQDFEMNDGLFASQYEDETPSAPTKANVIPFSFAHTLRTLRQPVEPNLVRTRDGYTDRSGQKHKVEYVEWHTVADILDQTAPTWSHTVKKIAQIGELIVITVAITIDGVTREGIGTGAAMNETGIKKAEHDALKRAAIKFGIARDLYKHDSDFLNDKVASPEPIKTAAPRPFPTNPIAKSVSELATPKQIVMIRAVCRDLDIDVEMELQDVMKLSCKLEELSRRAASSFIDHLKMLQEENEIQIIRRAS